MKLFGLALCVVALGVASCEAKHPVLMACTGTEGVTPLQTSIPFAERTLPDDPKATTAIKESLVFDGNTVVLEGNSHWVSGSYKACAVTEQSLWFSPAGQAGCDKGDEYGDLGVLNRVTGDFHYHVATYLAVMTCRKSERLL